MTISSTTRIAGPFTGNGTASTFPFTFKVFAAADLDVVRLNSSTGVESTLVLSSDYSVTLNGDQNSNPGGSITLLAGALATGFKLTITSDIANLQPTDLTNQGGFYPEVITDSFDRSTIQIQQMSQDVGRSLKAPLSDGTPDMELPTAAQRANSFLAFDANGLPTAITAGTSGAPTTITRQVFSGTGSQTVFTLASDPGALGNSAQVYIGGVYQQRSTYTIAGTTLTFSAAPVAGTDNIEFVNFLTSTIGATSADLVTYTPSGTGAVARSAASKMGDVVSVEDFGAIGDGVTNDTAAIQNALNTLKEVRGTAGKTYLVRRVAGTRYCLLWKSGMRWLGCGSTIKLGNGEYTPSVGCSVLMSEGTDPSPSTITSNTSFVGAIDGNSANQTAVPGSPSGNWFTPTVYVNKIARTYWDITVSNGHVMAFYTSGTASEIYDNTLSATVYGSMGGGVWFSGTRWNVPYINVRDTPYINNGGSQGNPLVVNVTDSTFGRIWAQNFGLGVKFQGDTSNITVDSIIAFQGAGTSATTDRSVKFQGDGPNGLRNIAVGNIVAEGFKKGSLYIFNCDNISIGSYIGRNNGQDAVPENDRVDTYIVDSQEVSIGNLTVDGCGQYPLITQSDSNSIHISQFTCVNTPNATPLWYNKSGSPGNQSNITFGTIAVRNETAGWASPLNVTPGNCNAYIGQASIDVPFSNYTAAGRLVISASSGSGSVRTGPITFRNSPTSAVVQLTNNSTTTAVSSAPAMVATNGIDCAPIIKVEPVSFNGTNSSNVLQAGRFTASAGNQTTGGITIRHPATTGTTTRYVRWTIEGYQAPGDCLEATDAASLATTTTATAAAILDRTNAINLGGKHTGQLVWDTTNNRMMYSSGATDVSPWYVVDGSASITPV